MRIFSIGSALAWPSRRGEKRRGDPLDPREWDGVNMERKGNPEMGFPLECDDRRDAVINTGLTLADLHLHEHVEVWFRGFWWQCTSFRKAPKYGTVSISYNHNRIVVSGYRVTLMRKL